MKAKKSGTDASKASLVHMILQTAMRTLKDESVGESLLKKLADEIKVMDKFKKVSDLYHQEKFISSQEFDYILPKIKQITHTIVSGSRNFTENTTTLLKQFKSSENSFEDFSFSLDDEMKKFGIEMTVSIPYPTDKNFLN